MSIRMQRSLITLSFLLVMLLARLVSCGQLQIQFNTYVPTSCSPQEQVACAFDSQPTYAYNASHGQCVVGCMMLSRCEWYNFLEDIALCHLFTSQPEYFGTTSGCSLYQGQSGDLVLPQLKTGSVAKVAGVPADCTFPYTYKGQLYYSCSNLIGQSLACSNASGATFKCTSPDFNALNVTVKIVTPPLPAFPTTAVFGWIIIQQKLVSKPTTAPYPWLTYRNGFGSMCDEFWLGLERVYQLTSAAPYRLRVEVLLNSTGKWLSAEYSSFSIGDETVYKYKFRVAGFTGGDAGEGFLATASCPNATDGIAFSTYDMNDVSGCASWRGAGWWFLPTPMYYCYCRTCLTCTGMYNGQSVAVRRMMIKPAY